MSDQVRALFEGVDDRDWKRLDQILGYSAHGKFWRDIFNKLRRELEQKEGETCLVE